MEITITINHCHQCHHLDHSGAFTIRGARDICGHDDACAVRATEEAFRAEYPEYYDRDGDDLFTQGHWKYHWYHRVVDVDNIPDWCPLKHGGKY